MIGAVYLDQGLDAAVRAGPPAVRPADRGVAPRSGAGLDWKTSLQELTAAEALGVPEYLVDGDRPRPRQDLHRRRPRRWAASLRHGHRPQQEGSRAAGRRGGAGARSASAAASDASASRPRPTTDRCGVVRSAERGRPCPNCPRSRSSGAAWSAGSPAATVADAEVLHPRAVRRHLAGRRRVRRPARRAARRSRPSAAASTCGCRWRRRRRPARRTSG